MRTVPCLLPIAALLASGCNVDAPKQYLVPDLRVLAVRAQVVPATTLAADPQMGATMTGTTLSPSGGETVQLEALVANPLNRATPTIEWYTCDPQTFANPKPPCFDDAWLGNPSAFATATPADGVYALGSANPATLALATAPQTLRQAILQAFWDRVALMLRKPDCDLYVGLQIVVVVRSEGVTEVAVKRVRVVADATLLPYLPNDKYVPNLNPVAGALQANPGVVDTCTGGVPLANACTPATASVDCAGGACGANGRCALPGGPVTLCAAASPPEQAAYSCPPDGSAPTLYPETLQWQWYVTAGEIAGTGFQGNATGDHIDLTPPGGAFTLWAILRDGRGGTDWFVRSF